ncbi:hypothetical protein JXA32_08785 [Candidatus Sumerlaeota bacterium]|nr:hypothetical protein [Candidatus Sumerlaeota bacterium]
MPLTPNSLEQRSGWNFIQRLPSLIFFLLFFLDVYLYIDPALIHISHFAHWRLPPYVPGLNVFSDLPAYPGKLAVFAAGWLLHIFYYSWAGAASITALAWILFWGADKYIGAMSDGRLRWLRFVPAIVLLAQYSRYCHYLMENISIAFGVLLVCLYLHASKLRPLLRLIIFLALSAILYYAAVFSYLLFVALCASYEVFHQRHWINGLAALLSVLLIPLIASMLVFDQTLASAYLCTLPYEPLIIGFQGPWLYLFLYLFFPLAGLFGAFWRSYAGKMKDSFKRYSVNATDSAENADPEIEETDPEIQEQPVASKLQLVFAASILLIVVLIAVFLSTDNVERQRRRIKCFAQHEMWTELLSEANELGPQDYDFAYCHDVSRALYHSGRLLDDLFHYPQVAGWQLYKVDDSISLSPADKMGRNSNLCDSLYEMGRVNEAENYALDALAGLMYHPHVLKRLALINIVKRQPDAARTFLIALREDFIFRNEAQELLDQLDADPDFTSNEEIQRIRSFMPVKDSIEECSPETLLRINPNNRMAFEYLMAYYLQTNQVADVVTNTARMAELHYDAIPRACEEAILIFMHSTQSRPFLNGYPISAETQERFFKFDRIIQSNNKNLRAAQGELEAEFGDSYFFYNLYGYNRIQKK